MDIVKNENITFLISIPGALVTNILLVFFSLFFGEQNWRIYYQLEVCSLFFYYIGQMLMTDSQNQITFKIQVICHSQ